jgi:hypothetical protein
MVERARGKGNLRTKTITMYCVLIIATVVLKYLKRVSILIFNKSVINLDNIKVFRRFVYQRNIKRNLDL